MSEFVLRDKSKKAYFVIEDERITIGNKARVKAFIRASYSGMACNMEPCEFGIVERLEDINDDFYVAVTDKEYLILPTSLLIVVKYANVFKTPKKNKCFKAIGMTYISPEKESRIFIRDVHADEVIDTFKEYGLYIVKERQGRWYCCKMMEEVLPVAEF